MNFGIHNIDGLDMVRSIPNNSVHLVLTDPPYIISKQTGMNKIFNGEPQTEYGEKKYGKKYAIQTDYGKWDKKFTIEDLELFIKEFYRILKPGGACIVFFDLWKIETLSNILIKNKFSKLRFIEWIKTNPVPINSKATYLSNAREIAIACVKGSKQTFNSVYDNGVYMYPIYQGKKGVDRIHPTQKSLPLFEDIIKKHTNENDIVVDPFAGSGTTFIACNNTNRKCMSAENDKHYYSKILKRIQLRSPTKNEKALDFFDD
jgi:site-specific DNA-methyltransferase (adenine-specific)